VSESAVDVLLHPTTGERLDVVIVHQHREGDGQFALALAEHTGHVRIEPEHLSGDIELSLGDLPRVRMVRLWLRKASHRRRLYLLSHGSSYSFRPAMHDERRRAPITLHGTVTPRMTILASVSLATFLVAGLAASHCRTQPLDYFHRLT